MIVQRVSVVLLAVLAVALGINLLSASGRFVTAHDTYDRIELELTTFQYVAADAPIETTFVARNPTSRAIEVIEIELGLNVGVHRVGGGVARPRAVVPVGEELATPMRLVIYDIDYVQRRDDGALDWRLRGRILVRIDPDIDPEWIPFTVRHLPE
ncbi:MAG TPA: hypothetical protein VMM78_11575 [Thermomicrobiales bacterium]|nr:hypothetical protein [Thermomicrobiales bacterium]